MKNGEANADAGSNDDDDDGVDVQEILQYRHLQPEFLGDTMTHLMTVTTLWHNLLDSRHAASSVQREPPVSYLLSFFAALANCTLSKVL